MTVRAVLPKKTLGVLMHPSCIPGGIVCGTFGKGAKEWIKKLQKHGIEYWQFLPLNPTDSTGSPYSSPSSFALNPWFLDIDNLIEKGWILVSKKEELVATNQKTTHFDFDLAKFFKALHCSSKCHWINFLIRTSSLFLLIHDFKNLLFFNLNSLGHCHQGNMLNSSLRTTNVA